MRQELGRHLVFGAVSRSGVVERVFFEKDLLDVVSQMMFEVMLVLGVLLEWNYMIIVAVGKKLLKSEGMELGMGPGVVAGRGR